MTIDELKNELSKNSLITCLIIHLKQVIFQNLTTQVGRFIAKSLKTMRSPTILTMQLT